METTINQHIEKQPKELRKFSILYVDSNESNQRSFRNDFSRRYKLFIAASTDEALKVLKDIEIHLIIVEPRLDDMCGIELLKQAVSINPEIIKILSAADEDAGAIIRAVNTVKIDKYLPKPWNKKELATLIDEELMKFRQIDPFTLEDLPHLNFQSRIGDEILAENCDLGDSLPSVFRHSFEIKNYPQEAQSNLQWVGESAMGHKVVILLNMIPPKGYEEEFRNCMSASIQEVVLAKGAKTNPDMLEQISACYKQLINDSEGDESELSICAVFIHEKENTIEYFSNYQGLKLFGRNMQEFQGTNWTTYPLSDFVRVFLFSNSFNQPCLGDLTYSELINESMEMELERQGHFLEMEVLNSSLIASNLSIIGIDISKSEIS